jgi:hypothetical protein
LPETETGGNTEHCYHRGGRREDLDLDLNLDLPSSRLFTSFVAWRKKEEVVSREKIEPLSLVFCILSYLLIHFILQKKKKKKKSEKN